MAFEFKLPDIGEGVAEGEVVRWLVEEGATVEEDQLLVEVMTDKATVEIPSPRTGTILEIRAREGETVPVGSVLVVIGEGEARPAGSAGTARRSAAAAPAKVSSAGRAGPQSATAVTDAGAPPPAAAARPAAASGRVLATPATRKLAREAGVDIGGIEGTGPRGRVTSEDVRRQMATLPATPGGAKPPSTSGEATPPAAARPQAPTRSVAPPRAPGELEQRIPVRGLRKRIAQAMQTSKRTAAHFTYVDECDVTQLKSLREGAKEVGERRGVRITYMPFILKALVASLRDFPYLNATYDEDRGEIVLKHYYNIGIAVDTEAGLIVPVVKDVDRKSIFAIAQELTELAQRARDGKSHLEDLQDGTFTITNAGNIGGLFATPVINYPEVAILGVHKIHQRPVVHDGEIVIRDWMYLSLSLDHRVVDGAMGARFMNQLIRYLADPKLLLLETV